jgi:renal tumor antigen
MLRQRFRVIRKLGEGSFSRVLQVQFTGDDTPYALKELKAHYHSLEDADSLPEVRYLRALQDCPSVIKLVDVIFDPGSHLISLVLEFCDCDLYQYIKSDALPLSERVTLFLMYQLLAAIAAMHSRGLFHRDVKPENCMINRRMYKLKLADLGSVREDHGHRPYTEYVSTRWYRAPECILTSGDYGPEVDLWSVGCILYECLTLRPLFQKKHEMDQINRIHRLCGKPSKELIAKFQKNPNPCIPLEFSVNANQDLKELLPHVSLPVG